ncbi:hypothetical protein UFOVP116_411 [uncultured Caudovirales phage]|uniref:Uncharacterized protein n=1 Tax=uncultured Caudovirales phage TaxID=2100421 RepID=A0A6J5L7G4_9CAUD|nr:hypothetical protein UFOVP116_411 [uncultured Caudovirales phage]
MAILPNTGFLNDLKSAGSSAVNSAGNAAFAVADSADSAFSAIGNSMSGLGEKAGNVAFDVLNAADSAFDKVKSAASGMLSSAQARLQNAGMNPGGSPVAAAAKAGAAQGLDIKTDWRMRISVGEKSNIFYKHTSMFEPDILAPLLATDGVLFPYTPAVTVSYVNNYSPVAVTHGINSIQAYMNSDVSSIQIAGNFSAQTPSEARYVMAVIHFFRSASKMFFGSSDSGNAGSPPPILFLNGFGHSYFPNVPVILTSFSHTMPDEVDYITYTNDSGTYGSARIPTFSTINLTLIPQYSRAETAKFNLDKFASGALLEDGRGFI